MSFEKSGIVEATVLSEPQAYNMANSSSYSYTPTTGQNSCIERQITGFELGKQYYVEVIITWKGFDTSNTAGTFNAWFQGSQYDTTNGWGWNHSNPMTAALTNNISLKTLVLSSNSGSKLVSGTFKADCTGYALGCRMDYSNGTGVIQFSNPLILPIKYYLNNSGIRIFENEIISNSIIEF